MRTKKRRMKMMPVVTVFCIVIFSILFICGFLLVRSLKENSGEIKVLNTIDSYQYVLKENDSSYFHEKFLKLKEELGKDVLEEEVYASLVAQLFLADFYSLDVVVNKNDVGGVQFVYEAYQEDFLKHAKDTIYRHVENKLIGKRTQTYPLVKEVEITSIKQKLYDSSVKTDGKAFYIDASITYQKDLGYPTEVSLILVHNKEKLEVAKMK